MLRQEGLGVRVEDAREVFDDRSLSHLNAKKPDHFSDHFRIEGIAQKWGVWVDLDLLFTRQLHQADYIVGWQEPGIISNAVLMLPSESPILQDYLRILRKRPVSVAPPWLPKFEQWRLRLKHARRRLRGNSGLALPYGPPALTHLVEKHALADRVSAPEAFYPMHWSEVGRLFREEYEPAAGTYTIHLWRNYCSRYLGSPVPSKGSYLWRIGHGYAVL